MDLRPGSARPTPVSGGPEADDPKLMCGGGGGGGGGGPAGGTLRRAPMAMSFTRYRFVVVRYLRC